MFKVRLLLAILAVSLLPASAANADQAILIGGGYNVNGSQGQIELNVNWVQSVLDDAELPVVTFFTDGDDPAPDVHYVHSKTAVIEPSVVDQLAAQLEPLARLFGDQQSNEKRFRNHIIENVNGGTEANSLTTALTDILRSAPDDPTLLIYNGHGGASKSHDDQVTIELWEDTQMTASQLHSVLGESNAPSRFVFTQCYSGGFHRLAYKDPKQGLELSSDMRCGFTAESAYRPSEGCSASVNTSDYRDYTTYFFAALNGYDRDGEIVPVDTDTNQDGVTSLREAHFYTLEYAHSTDMSRSTSEDYLSAWQPWFLKWNAGRPGLPNNEYAKLFRTIADKHSINLNANTAKSIREKLSMYTDTIATQKAQRVDIYSELYAIQDSLIYEAQGQWPALTGPYSATFQIMAASGETVEIAQWISEQPAYQRLLDLQKQDETIEKSILDSQRNLTQMQKLFHFRKLARLKNYLYSYGDPQQITDYERLVSCEDTPLAFTR